MSYARRHSTNVCPGNRVRYSNLSAYTRGPAFENLAQARQWVEDQNRQRQDPNWTYEIGKNCRPFEDTDIEVCDETVDE